MKNLILQSLKCALMGYREETRKLYATAWRHFFTRCRDIARYEHDNVQSQETLDKLKFAVAFYSNKIGNAESAMQVLEARQQYISIIDDICKKKVNRIIRI